MNNQYPIVILLIGTFLLPFLWIIHPINGHTESLPQFLTNQFYVEFHGDDFIPDSVARRVANADIGGFRFLRRHLNQPNEFVFEHTQLPKVKRVNHPNIGDPNQMTPHENLLNQHPQIRSAKQQLAFERHKRGFKSPIDSSKSSASFNKKGLPYRTTYPKSGSGVYIHGTNDPLFNKEWYLFNHGQAGGTVGLDLNAISAWSQGITGKGVITAIMDDGIDYLHPDIAPNYDAESSYDYSSNDPFPYPRYTDDWFNSHGTRCAGEIASCRDNGICGVGVAYGSKVAGLRMLDQPYMTDLIEAAAMSHNRDKIHIYSASWGPTDDGMTVDGPRNQTMRAIVDGVNKGRNGKGSIYVWASGDGGPDDDCNCDGYAASMWTISINSATNDGQTASYDESCSSTLASTFSNGKAWDGFDAGVGTIDLYGNCTLHHSGTSAAAPEAAAVFALALEANPNLTWRDLQHLIVLTSKRNHLHDPEDYHKWILNGAGLEINHLFGYGVLDAGDMVYLAKNWAKLPERLHCIGGKMNKPYKFNRTHPLIIKINTNACGNSMKNNVNFLEHVQAFITLKSSRRGDVTMFLTSPMGTKSMILSKRPKDYDNTMGFNNWPFMTTHMWAENPRGEWKLTVMMDSNEVQSWGVISAFSLVFHGTKESIYESQSTQLKGIDKLKVVKRRHSKDAFAI